MIRKVLGKTLGFLGYAIQYGCVAHCTFEYLGEIVICAGPSMEPTIKNYDILVCDNLSRLLFSIHKGDIIIAKSPNKPNINICKRVIGLEGDKVCTSSPSDFIKRHTYISQIIIYGRHYSAAKNVILTEGLYQTTKGLLQYGDENPCSTPIQVPKGHVWLEGDNLDNSTDSRSYGPVPYALIRGRVCLRLWPLNAFGPLQENPNGRVIKE